MTRLRDDRGGSDIEVLELLAEVSGKERGKERWAELRLWTAQEALYAIEKVGVSRVIGERTRRTAWLCGDAATVRKTVGGGPLSKRLLKEAKL